MKRGVDVRYVRQASLYLSSSHGSYAGDTVASEAGRGL